MNSRLIWPVKHSNTQLLSRAVIHYVASGTGSIRNNKIFDDHLTALVPWQLSLQKSRRIILLAAPNALELQ